MQHPTDYCRRYYILAFHAHEEPAVTPETCAAILEKAKLENWAMGKTKVKLHLNSTNFEYNKKEH